MSIRPISDKIRSRDVSALVMSDTPLTCPKTASVREVLDLMNSKNVGSIVIVENKKPIGIFTERDVLKKLSCIIEDKNLDLRKEKIETYMTPNPVCVKINARLDKVMLVMRIGKFRHLVVTDQYEELIGVISIRDIMDHLYDEFSISN